MFASAGVTRGCGTREEDGVYIEVASGPGGQPLEHFLADPPEPFETDVKIGVQLVEREQEVPVMFSHPRRYETKKVVHVLDWIGSSHYPFAADFVEEGRSFGFSRRVNRDLDFGRLSIWSRLIVVHARGLVTNRTDLPSADPTLPFGMPWHRCARYKMKGTAEHFDGPDPEGQVPACNRYQWADAEPTEADVTLASGTVLTARRDDDDGDLAGFLSRVADLAGASGVRSPKSVAWFRRHADTRYQVWPSATNYVLTDGRGRKGSKLVVPQVQARPAIIASLPIGGIGVVRARDGRHEDTLAQLIQAADGTGLRLGVLAP